MSKFDAVRKYRGKWIKRGKMIMYGAGLFSISSTDGDGITLRKQYIIHPWDEFVISEPSPELKLAIALLESGMEFVIDESPWMEEQPNVDHSEVERLMRVLIRSLKSNYRQIERGKSDVTQ